MMSARFTNAQPGLLQVLYFLTESRCSGPSGLRPSRFRSSSFDLVGAWLSLVEHLVRDQGVGGSNPLAPTNVYKHLQRIQACTFWVQFVQLAIGVPMVCGNQGQLALP